MARRSIYGRGPSYGDLTKAAIEDVEHAGEMLGALHGKIPKATYDSYSASLARASEGVHTTPVSSRKIANAIGKDLARRFGYIGIGVRSNPVARFRVTLPGNYVLSTPGHKDPDARQGHYSRASTPADAARDVYQRLHMTGNLVHFDVQPWDDKALRSDPHTQTIAVGPTSRRSRAVKGNPMNNPSELTTKRRASALKVIKRASDKLDDLRRRGAIPERTYKLYRSQLDTAVRLARGTGRARPVPAVAKRIARVVASDAPADARYFIGGISNPSDVDIRERFDRCVRDVSARGGAYNPYAICAASMRKAYGTQFQRIAASGRSAQAAERHARGEVRARATGRLERRPASRLRATAVQRRGELARIRAESAQAYARAYGMPAPVGVTAVSAARRRLVGRAAGAPPRVLAAVANPVEQLIQSRVIAPGHVIFEWVDVARGRWADASHLAGEPRRPARKPGPHLVAPGAQLLVMQGRGGPTFQYNRALFVRHHKHWRMASPMSHPVEARIGEQGVEVAGSLPSADRAVMTMLSAYAAASLRGRPRVLQNPFT